MCDFGKIVKVHNVEIEQDEQEPEWLTNLGIPESLPDDPIEVENWPVRVPVKIEVRRD